MLVIDIRAGDVEVVDVEIAITEVDSPTAAGVNAETDQALPSERSVIAAGIGVHARRADADADIRLEAAAAVEIVEAVQHERGGVHVGA